MDEKGIQMGGGQGKRRKKYYYFMHQKNRHRIMSNNLELVTVLECVSAAGSIVPPSFCLQNGTKPDLHHLNDDNWGRFSFLCFSC
jgi:hypothetical protein